MEDKQYEQIETEHGIFTNNTATGETAEEVYKRWLENKGKSCVQQTEEQKMLTEIIISML